ncbi:ParB/RepB/Spo0J family partition protein [Streptomyces sp. NPDC055287]
MPLPRRCWASRGVVDNNRGVRIIGGSDVFHSVEGRAGRCRRRGGHAASAASREEFINFLLKENLDREDFDVVERARGVQALVAVCSEGNEAGARTRAAERLVMSKAWVTNQLALLTLPEDIQEQLSSGVLPERDGRHLKAHPELDSAQLLEHLAAAREQEAQARLEETALLQAAKNGSVLTAVNTDATPPAPSADPPVLTAVNTPSATPRPEGQQSGSSAASTSTTPTPEHC